MRIVCWQTTLMKYHTLFFQKLGKMSQNVSSAAVGMDALRIKQRSFLTQRHQHYSSSHHYDSL